VHFHRVTEFVALLIEARYERSLLGLRARLAKLDQLVLNLCRLRNYADTAAAVTRAA
jgi:hypothetical protein